MVFPALVFVECGKVDWEVGGLRRSGAWVTQRSRFLAFWCDGSHVAFEVNLTFHGDTHIINAYINIYILYMYIQIFRCRYKYIYIYCKVTERGHRWNESEWWGPGWWSAESKQSGWPCASCWNHWWDSGFSNTCGWGCGTSWKCCCGSCKASFSACRSHSQLDDTPWCLGLAEQISQIWQSHPACWSAGRMEFGWIQAIVASQKLR